MESLLTLMRLRVAETFWFCSFLMVSRVALVRLKLTDESDLLDALVMQNSSSFLFKLRNNISLASCTDNVADANRYIECASRPSMLSAHLGPFYFIFYICSRDLRCNFE